MARASSFSRVETSTEMIWRMLESSGVFAGAAARNKSSRCHSLTLDRATWERPCRTEQGPGSRWTG